MCLQTLMNNNRYTIGISSDNSHLSGCTSSTTIDPHKTSYAHLFSLAAAVIKGNGNRNAKNKFLVIERSAARLQPRSPPGVKAIISAG